MVKQVKQNCLAQWLTAGHPSHDLESEGWLNLNNETTSHGVNIQKKLQNFKIELPGRLPAPITTQSASFLFNLVNFGII